MFTMRISFLDSFWTCRQESGGSSVKQQGQQYSIITNMAYILSLVTLFTIKSIGGLNSIRFFFRCSRHSGLSLSRTIMALHFFWSWMSRGSTFNRPVHVSRHLLALQTGAVPSITNLVQSNRHNNNNIILFILYIIVQQDVVSKKTPKVQNMVWPTIQLHGRQIHDYVVSWFWYDRS